VSALSCQWWFIGLASLAVLSSLLLALSLSSRAKVYKGRDIRHPGLTSDNEGRSRRGFGALTKVEACINLAFVSIIVLCAALFLVSQFPGWESPVWLGLVLQAFTYLSAAIFHVSG
jgi:hypothetical protein